MFVGDNIELRPAGKFKAHISLSILIVLLTDEKKSVTVDGILLSTREKQKYNTLRFNPNLFFGLLKEHHLFKNSIKKYLANRRSDTSVWQDVFDKQFGLVLCTK